METSPVAASTVLAILRAQDVLRGRFAVRGEPPRAEGVPAARPRIVVGSAKCVRKGHRPPNREGRCSRCGAAIAVVDARADEENEDMGLDIPVGLDAPKAGP